MRVTNVKIRNFRGIQSLDLNLDRVTVLIGENNTGKTSVLDALKVCLRGLGPKERHTFSGLDFHLTAGQSEPSSALPINIEVTLSETEGQEWSAQLTARLTRAKILQFDDQARKHVRLRVTCQYDDKLRDFQPKWLFLDTQGDPLSRVSTSALVALQNEVKYYYLTALRDAASHFGAKGLFWKPFLEDSQLSLKEKAEIETRLREVNELVVSSHASFKQVERGLRRARSVIPLGSGEQVSIEAVPDRMFDMLARSQVWLEAGSGAKIPLYRHGAGTQSLSVLMLFSAFLEAHSKNATVLALEEPEAHLHPSATRSLLDLVRELPGQKLVSTHSGELLAETDLLEIRRLARKDDEIRAFQVPVDTLSKNDIRMFNYHIRQSRGELLFARCWLFVEGQTETWVYPAAARALGLNLHREGVRTVEFSQSNVGVLAKIANLLGIPWYCVGDNDRAREKNEPRLLGALAGADKDDRFEFPYSTIEECLKRHGYKEEYKKYPSNREKTKAAAAVALKMEAGGEKYVPLQIDHVLRKAVSLAQRGVS